MLCLAATEHGIMLIRRFVAVASDNLEHCHSLRDQSTDFFMTGVGDDWGKLGTCHNVGMGIAALL